MKKKCISLLVALCGLAASVVAQQYSEPELFGSRSVTFRKIDDHTFFGTGHMMFNESIYVLVGSERVLLIDCGTVMPHLDQLIRRFAWRKPVTLVATHAHPDHTGLAVKYFDEILVGEGDTADVREYCPDFRGKIGLLTDGMTIDLGDRTIEVVLTPGHTAGSATFVDKAMKRGFSGDSFGSGHLLVFHSVKAEMESCRKMKEYMQANGIESLYPGHYSGNNQETLAKVELVERMCADILAGKAEAQEVTDQLLNHMLTVDGMNVLYNEASLKR